VQIAYLLLVHNQPNHFARLIRALNAPWAHFFVYVDKKADIAEFLLRVPETANVHYVCDRKCVFWGGFNLVRATLKLLEDSLSYGIPFKYHVLLSGSDYPIKNNHFIYETLNCSSSQHIWIDNELLLLRPERVSRYWFNDNFFLNERVDLYIKPEILKRLAPKIRRRIQSFLLLFGERRPPCFRHYIGSQWWALTGNCVKYIMEFLREHKEYVEFHKYSSAPDEFFFHSIIKASSFLNAIDHSERYCSPNQAAFHYREWSLTEYYLPKILIEEDQNNLISTNALFARKFDEVKSAKLLDSIDRQILKRETK